MLRALTARKAAQNVRRSQSAEQQQETDRQRWWTNKAPKGNAENADAFFEATAEQPTQEDLVLDVLSNEQMAEIETAWFTIDADRSGYLCATASMTCQRITSAHRSVRAPAGTNTR